MSCDLQNGRRCSQQSLTIALLCINRILVARTTQGSYGSASLTSFKSDTQHGSRHLQFADRPAQCRSRKRLIAICASRAQLLQVTCRHFRMGRDIGSTCKAAPAFGILHRTYSRNLRATLQVVLTLPGAWPSATVRYPPRCSKPKLGDRPALSRGARPISAAQATARFAKSRRPRGTQAMPSSLSAMCHADGAGHHVDLTCERR